MTATPRPDAAHAQPARWLRLSLRARLPLLLQTETAECGLACLGMVAGFHGLRTDLTSLRRRFAVSRKGTSLKGLMAMARGLGLVPRPVKLDLAHLPALSTPAILHWDMNHFVVLKEVSGQTVTVHDPVLGVRTLSMAQFSRHFTGVAMELSPAGHFEAREDRMPWTWRGLMGRVTGLRRGLLQVLILAISLEVIAIASPFYMQWVVDHALVAADRDLLTVLAVGFLLLVLIQTTLSALRSWIITTLSVNLNFQWLSHVFAHLLRLPLDYFDKRHIGDITSRFSSITTIQKTLTTGFVQALVDGALVLGTFCMMALYSLKLAAIAGVAVLLYLLLRWLLMRPLMDASTEQIVHAARQQTHFLETARGIQGVRLFNRADERRVGWTNMLADQFNADLRTQRIGITYQAAQGLLFGAERVLLIWLAARAVLDQQFSVGMLFAFVSYKEQFSQRVTSLIDKAVELRMLRLHGERVADIVLTRPEDPGVPDEVDTANLQPCIEARGITFAYAASEPPVLHGVDLRIEAGECVAIAGMSGGGKTTLIKILLGLLQPTEGEVRVGGIPIRQLGLENYREMIGTVMQDDTLFTGSIADNISFFDANPEPGWIEACARRAALLNDVVQMPMGFNTLVGDSASGLSGGQRQRILLARALYRRPRILVLDEATSHLDLLNEQIVNDAIAGMQLTRLIVAHRPQTLALASRVLVLHQGSIVPAPDASQASVSGPEATLR